MDDPAIPVTTTVTVYTRHIAAFPKRTDRYWRLCNSRKARYICEEGAEKRISARTKSWEQAEKSAQTERDCRDPVKQKLREIEEAEAQRVALLCAKAITVPDATDRWLRAQR